MGEIAVVINHALSLKLGSNNNPWDLYKSNSLPQLKLKFKFNSKLNPKPPVQSQTKAYLHALRSLSTTAANSFL